MAPIKQDDIEIKPDGNGKINLLVNYIVQSL